MRQRFGTLEGVARAAGIDPASLGRRNPMRDIAADNAPKLRPAANRAATIGEAEMARSTRSRRYAYDEELDREDLKELIDDPSTDFGDLLAAVIEQAPEDKQEEIHEAVRALGEDKRGPRSWARDRMERRRLGKDIRRGRDRRTGRDQPPEFEDRPRAGGEDRRRMGADAMPYGGSAHAEFERMFGSHAAKIERG